VLASVISDVAYLQTLTDVYSTAVCVLYVHRHTMQGSTWGLTVLRLSTLHLLTGCHTGINNYSDIMGINIKHCTASAQYTATLRRLMVSV
jgi:hypothetical protein